MQLIDEKITAWQQLDQKRNAILKQRIGTYKKYIEDNHEQQRHEDEVYFARLANLEQKIN